MIKKYEYMLFTWGGFYNEEHKIKHNKEDGYFYFDNKEDRDIYLQELKDIEKELDAKFLAKSVSEGYNVRSIERLTEKMKLYEYRNDVLINGNIITYYDEAWISLDEDKIRIQLRIDGCEVRRFKFDEEPIIITIAEMRDQKIDEILND